MKFSEQWLREWVNPDISTTDLAAQLTMAGLEVDAVEPAAPFFSNVLVGEVLSVEPHPAADRLRVCQVSVGEDKPLGIVCGASNVAVGVRVPTAIVGAKLPGGLVIEKTSLRGVDSEGMLCSAKELGLADSSEGLMLLPTDAEPGRDIRDYLALSDVCIELGITPNRGDCLSIQGIARETATINRSALAGPEITPVAAAIDEDFTVEVEAPEACPRYLGRVVRDINQQASTPMWMKERLRRSGLRSISAVVDITNYVLLELGQPMHAFDLEKLHGGIKVRMAKAGEQLKLLDEQAVKLDASTLVIADHKGPVAMAGVMGGADSAVSDNTTHLFLESAFFAPAAMAGRARRYGLHTDSSHRFERGVDPELARRAMERATALLVSIVGGKPGPIVEQVSDDHLPKVDAIHLRAERLQRVIGSAVSDDEVNEILQGLGMEVSVVQGGWKVMPPLFRFDVRIEADLIEEVARIRGYDNLPISRPAVRMALPRRTETQIKVEDIRRRMIERGYQEAITYSFVDPRLQESLDPSHAPIALANPISADMAVMRTSLWPGLIQAALYNLKRQQGRIRLFEIGTRFRRHGDEVKEETVVGGIVTGPNEMEQWGLVKRDADFFDVKGDVEALLGLTGQAQEFGFASATHPSLHPGQTAELSDSDGQTIGMLGGLHPQVSKSLDISGLSFVFEVELRGLGRAAIPRFQEASKFPAIRRDLAVVLDEEASSAELCREVSAVAGGLLRELQLFDVYKGKGIDSGKKSIALGLTLQDSSRTLTDGDVDTVIEQVLARVREKFGATLRD